ncbi:MAG: hypothetical protein K6A41_04355 [Bacteroidales bacterium]|nr:hypothetical protein [Bacteroidales bacterium]
MEQQVNIQGINIIKAVIAALLLFAALSLCRHMAISRVSAPSVTLQWAADSSWVKGW